MWVLSLVVAAVIGFAGGQLALWVERVRVRRASDADWTLTPRPLPATIHLPQAHAWILTNTGTARADDVELQVLGGEVLREEGRRNLDRGASEMIVVPHMGKDGQLRITWKSHRGAPRGPVERFLDPWH